ncbi:unnamed protein product [Linum trigynum]|uniref:Uncharacterized protein n=1 Tax=Linum trigynum TaxID=586398 RepID=A0AAV2E5I4_9ROSI
MMVGRLSSVFPTARVRHLDKERSDHRPILCDTNGEEDEESKWEWSFKFDPHWVRHGECPKVIEEAWKQDPHADTLTKLLSCRSKFEQWSRTAFPNFRIHRARIRRARKMLELTRRSLVVETQLKQLDKEEEELDHNEELY